MGFFTKDIQSMKDLFLHGLQDVYYAEKQITGLLKSNLREEKAADKKLSALAEAKVNRKATGHRTAAARSGGSNKRSTRAAKRSPQRKKLRKK
jgi:ferritin-like metal-binding protein YciE